MKLTQTLLTACALLTSSYASQAANVIIANAQGGAGTDTLWANADGSLMTTGSVSVGYFGPTDTEDQIDTIAELFSKLGGFTVIDSATPGSSIAFMAPGYVAEEAASFDPALLIGRTLYAIATNASSLSAATISSAYSMFAFNIVIDDEPLPQDYTANPAGITPIIGSLDTFTGDPGGAATVIFGEAASGNYTTLKLVPEPSSMLLGAVGALGLLRRRRN
jgi:hypothetical protein